MHSNQISRGARVYCFQRSKMAGLRRSVAFLLLLLAVISPIATSPPLQIEEATGFPKPAVRPPIKHDIRTRATDYEKFKLPENVIPTRYEISIIPILEEVIEGHESWTAPGSVSIYIQCVEATSQIVIHKSPDLRVSEENVKVLDDNSAPVPVLPDFQFDAETEFFTINLATPLQAGNDYRLYLEFVGQIYDPAERLEGLYRSSYTNSEGVRSILATTQFEPTDFRRMVPSFDEPHFKTPIKIRIGRLNTKYVSLSNSPLSEDPNHLPIDIPEFAGWVWDDYMPTVPSPTYLVAIVVAEDYGFAEASTDDYDKPVKVYGPKELIEEKAGGEFAAENAAKQLAYYRDLFELDYQMHKMDSIAIPDFAAGAMENWGLNTYRVPYLLNLNGETTESERGFISNVLAHELAHQWFGNAVTCARWHYLWLNEGFATFLEYRGWQYTDPEFEPQKYFMNGAFQYALNYDATISMTHPVVNDAVTTDEINSFFTGITYEKGGSLLRMMEHFLGWETLRKGLVLYLNDMLHKAAVQDDLWRNLDLQAAEDGVLPPGATVKQIMDTWTLQAGFPVVRVSAASASRIYISQERVIPVPPLPDLNPNHLWYIPVGLVSAGEPWSTAPKFWIEPNYSLKSYPVNTNQWLVVNPSATGYYRVLYDTKLTDLLLAQLNSNHAVFPPESRSQFLDDYLRLAFTGPPGHVNIETALEFTKYLGAEDERIVWGAALTALRNSFNKLRGSESFEEFKRYLVPRLLSTLNAIQLRQPAGERGARVIFRATLLDWACAMGLPECAEYATDLYTDWVGTPAVNPVPIDIQAVMYCAIVVNGNADAFEFIIARYEAAVGVTQKTRLLNGLACTENTALVDRILAEVSKTDDSRFTDDDKINALVRVAGNTVARTRVLTFVETNLEALKAVRNAVSRTLTALVTNIGTNAELEAVTKFIEDNRPSLEEISPPLPLAAYLATIRSNIEWRATYENRMSTWFSANA